MILLLLLLQLFDHPSYRIRIAATRAFPVCDLTVPLLLHVERHGSQETAQRASSLLGTYYQQSADRLSRRLGKMPWIDREVLWDACSWLDMARGTPASTDWLNYREATRLYVASCIASRQSYAETLRQLRAEEFRWRWRHWWWK